MESDGRTGRILVHKVFDIKKTFKPNPARQTYYAQKYERFKKLYNLMHLF